MPDQDPQQSRSALASTWPNPPPFFHDFTEENLERFRQLAGDRAGGDDGPVKRIPDLPAELMHLQPPAEPADGTWRVFGDQYSVRATPVSFVRHSAGGGVCVLEFEC